MISIGGDTLFTFNYRSDRVREIVSVLGLPDKPMEVTVPDNLVSFSSRYKASRLMDFPPKHITTMTRYNAEFPFPIAFPPTSMTNVLAEWLAKQGVKQCHVAGKYLPPYSNVDRTSDRLRLRQKPKSTPTSPSSSTEVSKSNSRTNTGKWFLRPRSRRTTSSPR